MAVWPERPYEVHFFEKSCSGFPKSKSPKTQNGRKWTPGRRFGHLLVQNPSQEVQERHGTGFGTQNPKEQFKKPGKTPKIPKTPPGGGGLYRTPDIRPLAAVTGSSYKNNSDTIEKTDAKSSMTATLTMLTKNSNSAAKDSSCMHAQNHLTICIICIGLVFYQEI